MLNYVLPDDFADSEPSKLVVGLTGRGTRGQEGCSFFENCPYRGRASQPG